MTNSYLCTRTSQATGITHNRELPISPMEYMEGIDKWCSGELIQNAFPTLSADDREFIKTGITPEEWDDLFSGIED